MSSIPHEALAAGAVAGRARVRFVDRIESRTIRQYLQTLFWTFAAIGFCGLCYLVEKYIFRDALGVITDSTYRLFKNPAELPMRLFGQPHIIIGTLFLFSSKRMNTPNAWAILLGLTTLGILGCIAFFQFGTQYNASNGELDYNALALLVFYFYFLIHGFRDEAFFYRAYGEMPKEAAASHARIMTTLQILMLGLLISLAIPAYVLYGELKPKFSHPYLQQIFPSDWPYVLRFASTFVPMLIVAAVVVSRIGRRFDGGLSGLWRVHRPILIVFLGSTAIILLALFSGPWTFNAVVLMHFVGWYLFGRNSLAARPPAEPPKTLWKWMRTTRTGFTVLHLSLAAVFVILSAISTYAFGKTGVLEAIVGTKSFYFWTIMHVTLSFFPR